MRLHNRIQVLKLLNQHLGVYPTPMNLNWNWSWGSLSGLLLGSQIVTGILLAMHYVGHVDHAFASVQHLMVDVPSGVIIRYAHANGASLFFTVVYLHVLRGLYYSSGTQPREILWISGVIILLLMIITAFIGYSHSQKWFTHFGSNLESKAALSSTLSSMLTLFPYDYFVINNMFLMYSTSASLSTSVIKRYDNIDLIEVQLRIRQENKRKAGIYCVLNNITQDCYIGSASSDRINVRFRNHCINGTGSNIRLQRAIRKYGLKAFSFLILEYYHGFVHKEDLRQAHLKLLERENYYIQTLKPQYNLLTIAGSSLGYKHTNETKLKMRLNYSQERKDAIGSLNKGKELDYETKQLLSTKKKELFKDALYKQPFLQQESVSNTLFKGKKVQVYNINNILVSEYNSILEISRVFKCCRKTIRKYINQVPAKRFKNLYYLKYSTVTAG